MYRLAGAPVCFDGWVLAATLAGGDDCCASHATAGRLLGLAGVPATDGIELSAVGGRLVRVRGVRVRRSSALRRADVARIGPIRLTTAGRTLVDLAAVVHPLVLEEALDDAIRRRMVSVSTLARRVADLRRPGAAGLGTLADLLADRRLGATDSTLESRFLKLIRAARLPEPQSQLWISHGGRFLGRADFAYREFEIAIELDSWQWHGSRESFESDRLRQNDLVQAGWVGLLITDRQLRGAPHRVVQTIRRTIVRQSRLSKR